eukprot:25770_1
MAALSLKQMHMKKSHKFTIHNKKCYEKWDKFCVGSLKSAKEEIDKKRVFRYISIADQKAEEARLRHITAGVIDISEFIEEHGWTVFVTVAVGFAMTLTGAGIVGVGLTLANPVTLVIGGVAALGGATVMSYCGYKLYKHKALVVKVKDILSPIKKDFDRYQPGYKRKNKPQIHLLFDNSVQMIIEKIYECEIMVNDLSLPIKPICLCGGVLVPTLNKECYGSQYSYVICDICDQQIKNQKDVFHCPRKQVAVHPDGYDICIKCAREHNTKFKRYHAVIIQAIPERPQNGYNVTCKDATALKSLFESLNYHEIVVIHWQNAKKRTIKRALRRMSLNKKNDVVVICYTGHGERYNNHWMCCLKNNQTITDQELVESVKFGHNDAASFGDTCDIVIMLNACHSGQFGVQQNNDNNQQVDEEKMPQYLVDYDNLGRNMITIAACGSEENANFFGQISPFYKLVIEEMTNNKSATPETVHQYIERKSEQQNGEFLGLKLAAIQNVQKAFKNGEYALWVPLCPAVKKY